MLILRHLLEIYFHLLLQIFVLFLTCGEVLSIAGFDASSLANAIRSKLKVSGSVDPDRTFDVGSKLSGLVADGFDKLWTVSSKDYTPRNNSDSSVMGDNRELHFH